MNYSIVLTETAQSDLSAIFRYIAVDLQSVGWAIFHGLLSWVYVIYFLLRY